MSIDLELHQFKSIDFRKVIEDAVQFILSTPIHELPLKQSFHGTGVYAIYYHGGFEPYQLYRLHDHPLYVGKAVPRGWRQARTRSDVQSRALYARLSEHTRSIAQALNLNVPDFKCQFMILSGVESDIISTVEAAIIRRFMPLWNTRVDGFGNHDPGAGRYNQIKSDWDVLHPGRYWAERLAESSRTVDDILKRVQEHAQEYLK